MQTSESLPCSKAAPGAGEGAADTGGEGANSPSTGRGEKQIREMGVQGTAEAL